MFLVHKAARAVLFTPVPAAKEVTYRYHTLAVPVVAAKAEHSTQDRAAKGGSAKEEL